MVIGAAKTIDKMNGQEEVRMYRRRAIALDMVSLVLCFVVLYFGTNYDLPVWWMATGGIVALVALVLAVYNSHMARKTDMRRHSAAGGKDDKEQ